MRRSIGVPVAAVLGFAALSMAQSQAPTAPWGPPPILQRYREMVKVGRGDPHQANEHAWATAYAKSKIPFYIVAMTSMSGASDAWYFSAFSSFKELDEQTTAIGNNKELTAAVNAYALKDADYISDGIGSFWVLRPDLSYRDTIVWSQMHAYEMITVRARPGHNNDVTQIAQKFRATHMAAQTSARWAMYQGFAGVPDGTFLVIIPHKNVADLDVGMKEDPQFNKALGDVGAKELDKLSSDGIISLQTDIYAVDPKMSYVAASWLAADADFWKGAAVIQAGSPAPAKKEAKKP